MALYKKWNLLERYAVLITNMEALESLSKTFFILAKLISQLFDFLQTFLTLFLLTGNIINDYVDVTYQLTVDEGQDDQLHLLTCCEAKKLPRH